MILGEVNLLTNSFESVMFRHIYRERNFSADALAKAGGSISEGFWSIKEFRAAVIVETYQVF